MHSDALTTYYQDIKTYQDDRTQHKRGRKKNEGAINRQINNNGGAREEGRGRTTVLCAVAIWASSGGGVRQGGGSSGVEGISSSRLAARDGPDPHCGLGSI